MCTLSASASASTSISVEGTTRVGELTEVEEVAVEAVGAKGATGADDEELEELEDPPAAAACVSERKSNLISIDFVLLNIFEVSLVLSYTWDERIV